MGELIERVTRVETQGEAIRADIANLWTVLQQTAQNTQDMSRQLAALIAQNDARHTPETCPYRRDIRDCHDALWFARGGGKVILWLLGGGLLSLGAVIGFFVR